MTKKMLFSLLLFLLTITNYAQIEIPLSKEQRMQEWNEAKYGMFIHWGLYAIPAQGEWYMRKKKIAVNEYAKLTAEFNPVNFNATEWANIAKKAGMKYLVITAKHHDGFALFNSKFSNFNIAQATPFKRDVIKELSTACKKEGIKFGVYYSTIADWHHAGGQAGEPHWDPAQDGNLDDYMKNIAVPQIRELVTNYGSIYEFWFDNDGSKGINEALAKPILEEVRKEQPNIVISPRLFKGDFDVEEQNISAVPPLGYWEACITTTGSWGYVNKPAKSTQEILENIIKIASKGGNILLNVGPDATGLIPTDNVDRLEAIGKWLSQNGESIYGSQRGIFDYLPWGYCTKKENTLYLHIVNYPKDGILKLPLDNSISKAYFLADKGLTISHSLTNGTTILKLPLTPPDSIVATVVLKVEGNLKPFVSLALNKPTVSSNPANDSRSTSYLVDNVGATSWTNKDSTGWVEVDLQTEKTFAYLRVGAFYSMPQEFSLQYKSGDNWITIFDDTNMIRNDYVKEFKPVQARFVRLVINKLKPNETINLRSFELFPPID